MLLLVLDSLPGGLENSRRNFMLKLTRLGGGEEEVKEYISESKQ